MKAGRDYDGTQGAVSQSPRILATNRDALRWADSSAESFDHEHVVRRSGSVGLYIVADPPRAALEASLRIEDCSDHWLLRPGVAIGTEAFAAQRVQTHGVRKPTHLAEGLAPPAPTRTLRRSRSARAARYTLSHQRAGRNPHRTVAIDHDALRELIMTQELPYHLFGVSA